MPTVLVTGSSGRVGTALVPYLQNAGWIVRPFDLASGDELRDERAVLNAVEGCDMVVHAGAIAHDSAGTPADILATNVLGTWHVLLAAETHRLSRVVYFSSAQVFGFADGEGAPEYLPVDDNHPLRAARPYGMSKRLAEQMCGAWTTRTHTPTVVLRPVMILTDADLAAMSAADAQLGAFVHVDDVADAVVRALTVPIAGSVRMTLCGPGDFDTAEARRVLGWQPTRSWTEPDGLLPPPRVVEMSGGGRGGASRRGVHVVRPLQPWTPAVLSLLRHLEHVGYPYAPRVADGGSETEEALVYVEGDPAPERWTDDGIAELGAALRQLHNATGSFSPPPNSSWQRGWWTRSDADDAIIGHGDPAPWNVIVRDGRPAAFIDWEFAGPVDRIQEVAHAAWLNCQLHDDDVAIARDLLPAAARSRQLARFVDGYGLSSTERSGFVDRMIEAAILSAANEAVEGAVTPQTTDASALWGITWRARGAAWIIRNRKLLESSITR